MAINTRTRCDYDFDYENEDGDDMFFAELRKQILLLTDEDEDFPEHPSSSRATGRSANMPTAANATRSYCRWEDSTELSTSPVPAWLLNLWSNRSGTGVFIPHIVKSKRLPVRSNKATGRAYKPAGNKKRWPENI